MSVKHFEWGATVGGTDAGGGTTAPADALFGTPDQQSGTANPGDTTINFASTTKWVHVLNTDAANDLQVSFDGGTDFQPIVSYGDLKEEVAVDSIVLRTTVATTYSIIAALS